MESNVDDAESSGSDPEDNLNVSQSGSELEIRLESYLGKSFKHYEGSQDSVIRPRH